MKHKQISSVILTAAVLSAMFSGCSGAYPPPETGGEPRVVATLFPQYDLARVIAGGDAEVTLLLPPGVESHAFEPTPADIIRINKADLFIYTGDQMEPWAADIIGGLEGGAAVVDISENVPIDADGEPDAQDGHFAGGDHGGHDHGGIDPHIWTSPYNMTIMADNMTRALSAADPENAASYQKRADEYKRELVMLDRDFAAMVEGAKRREIVFGGRFAMRYFAERYELSYMSAFDSCSGETEPSVRAVAEIIAEIREKNIPVIFYEELTDPKVARVIAEETGAKTLLLHSCHNVSRDEVKAGATYLSLMRQNLENLREGLN